MIPLRRVKGQESVAVSGREWPSLLSSEPRGTGMTLRGIKGQGNG